MIVLFAFTGLWFWLYCLASFAMLCTCCYRDRYTVATIDMLVFVGLLSVTGYIPVLDIWHKMQTQPLLPAAWVGGYLVIGVLWATVKWKLLLRKLKGEFDKWRGNRTPDDLLAAMTAAEAIQDYDKQRRAIREASLPDRLENRGLTLKDGKARLDVANFKARITGWMGYWPVSALIWIVGDFLADVFDQIYRMVRGYFQGMADREFDS